VSQKKNITIFYYISDKLIRYYPTCLAETYPRKFKTNH